MKISFTMDINSRPEGVFLWLDDPGKAMVWMTSVSSTELLDKTPDMVGTTFQEIVEQDGHRTEMRGVVTGYVTGKLISFHLSGKFNSVDVEYRLEEVENRTRLPPGLGREVPEFNVA